MIKYFQELEDKKNQYLSLIRENRLKEYHIDIILSMEFYIKYKDLFSELDNMDVLYKRSLDNNQIRKFLKDSLYEGYDFEDFYSSYINHDDISYYLTNEGKNRVDLLVKIFGNHCKDYEYLYQYLSEILNLFFLDRTRMNWDQYSIKQYLLSTMVVARFQNKLSKDVEVLIKRAIQEIEKYKFKIPFKSHSPVNLKLPDCWYITPYKHLYNAMGTDGHKEANLIYPFYEIVEGNIFPNSKPYLSSIQKIKDCGYITNDLYENYLNLIYDFPCIYPDYYYELDRISKIMYSSSAKRSYNPKLVNLIIGIESAHAGLFNFFYQLRQYSCNYERDINIINKMDLNDILVRCCGFHKISSIFEKLITTSCINYEDEFREYIEKGWEIDFIPPIIINQNFGIIEEYPEDFLTIRTLLKK